MKPLSSNKDKVAVKEYLISKFTASMLTVDFGRYDNESPPLV